MSSNKNLKFEIVIRPSVKIKSRQWWQKQLRKIRLILLKHLSGDKLKLFKRSSLTVLITNNKEIQDLNKRFRKEKKPTDVLSFNLTKKEQLNKKYLGDIVISFEYAKNEALKKNIPIIKELQMLLIHGHLHLLGYDHRFKKDAKIMFSLQNKLLRELNNII